MLTVLPDGVSRSACGPACRTPNLARDYASGSVAKRRLFRRSLSLQGINRLAAGVSGARFPSTPLKPPCTTSSTGGCIIYRYQVLVFC